MKIIGRNLLFKGASGKIDDYVLRNVDGETRIALRPPKHTKDHVYTEAQMEHMTKFKLAVLWAKEHKSDPEFVEAAKLTSKPKLSAFNVAVRAAMQNPALMQG